MGRIVRACGSFGVVTVAYWAYAVVAVPLIEPPPDRYESGSPSAADLASAGDPLAHRLRELEGLFPPGSWELDSPQILESDRVKLLFSEYVNRPGGGVEFPRCTIILAPEAAEADPVRRKRQTVILQASDGALLKFDQPLSLSQTNLGKLHLELGLLQGRVTIRSLGKSPGPEDDLLFVGRDVELTEDLIHTPNLVEFRLGPNYGSGRDMRISLSSAEDGSEGHGLSFEGLDWFELRQLDRLCLWLPEQLDTPGNVRQSAPDPRVQRKQAVPIEITCRGPFRYDHLRQEASFEDHVDVIKINPQGPADKITCERLSVFFARSRRAVDSLIDPGSKGKRKPRSAEFDLEPCRIEARGNPVNILAPSQDVFARAEELEYDLQRKRITLRVPDDGRQHAEVFLRRGASEIHARRLEYQSMGPGRLGLVTALGPGWLQAQTKDGPPRQLSATWTTQLLVRPRDGQAEVFLSGDSKLTFGQPATPTTGEVHLGTLTAGEIRFWLFELPPDDSSSDGLPRLRPDRMSALGDVRLNSPQLTGTVEELGIWFEQERPPATQRQAAGPATGRITGVAPIYRPEQSTAADRRATARSASGERQFDITGKVLTSRVVIRDNAPELSDLTVEGNVVFRETRTAKPDEIPLIITGDQVQVLAADRPDTRVVVVGLDLPARLEGRGMKLAGTNIQLDRGSNRMWINGSGRLELPMDRDLEGEPLARPGLLNIDWREKMEFDGRAGRVSFFESVAATGPNLKFTTQRLDCTLTEPVDFADPNMDQEPEVARLECGGGVVMDSWTFEGRTQTAWNHIQSVDLSVDRLSGRILAHGPGQVTAVGVGMSKLTASPLHRGSDAGRATDSRGDSDDLTYLEVDFQDRIDGNLHDNTLTFHDQIRCVYGPVDSWDATLDADDPDSLGADGAFLTSDQLTVTRMKTPLDGRESTELVALGNVRAEGNMFSAWGNRMTYDQAKDLLILEGTGRADAELHYQERVGAPTQHAQMGTIRYWPKTKQIQIDDGRSVEFSQLAPR